MRDRTDVSNASVCKHDPEVIAVVCFGSPRLFALFDSSLAIIWMQPLPDHPSGRKALRWIETPDPIIFLGPVANGPVACFPRIGPTAGVGQDLRLREISFAAPQAYLSPLLILNIGCAAIPANHASRFILQGLIADKKPSILAIVPAQPVFVFKRRAAVESPLPCLPYPLKIIRKNNPSS